MTNTSQSSTPCPSVIGSVNQQACLKKQPRFRETTKLPGLKFIQTVGFECLDLIFLKSTDQVINDIENEPGLSYFVRKNKAYIEHQPDGTILVKLVLHDHAFNGPNGTVRDTTGELCDKTAFISLQELSNQAIHAMHSNSLDVDYRQDEQDVFIAKYFQERFILDYKDIWVQLQCKKNTSKVLNQSYNELKTLVAEFETRLALHASVNQCIKPTIPTQLYAHFLNQFESQLIKNISTANMQTPISINGHNHAYSSNQMHSHPPNVTKITQQYGYALVQNNDKSNHKSHN